MTLALYFRLLQAADHKFRMRNESEIKEAQGLRKESYLQQLHVSFHSLAFSLDIKELLINI